MLNFPVFTPHDWYWLADDGRIFCSDRQAVVKKTDAPYKEWLAAGNTPTRWPVDDVGAQTCATLQGVLTPYGLWVDLKAYTADKRWRIETGGVTLNGMKIATDRESQAMIGNAVQITAVTGQPIQFKAGNGFVELAPEQMQGVALAVAAHIQACFAAEADLLLKIESGEIDSFEKIDAYPWPGVST